MKTTSAMTKLCSDFVFIPAERHIAHSCDAQRNVAVARTARIGDGGVTGAPRTSATSCALCSCGESS